MGNMAFPLGNLSFYLLCLLALSLMCAHAHSHTPPHAQYTQAHTHRIVDLKKLERIEKVVLTHQNLEQIGSVMIF